jgi:hypothetical protein
MCARNFSERIDQYNVLRTVEDMFGLPHDGAAAAAAPITGILAPGAPEPGGTLSPAEP